MIFFLNRNYFNSSEHCQSKQTVSYNVEWCLQLQYVECSGDKWYCDTELLYKISKLHLQTDLITEVIFHTRVQIEISSSGRTCFPLSFQTTSTSGLLVRTEAARKSQAQIFFFLLGDTTTLRGIFCKQG